jgi:NAD(P)-dependent dehydrogenase (short-subunit alcohol dehydrogenase family)
MDLTGKRAIVTGASSGIGQATARALAEAGVRVAGGARRVERLETDVVLPLDVTDPESSARFVADAVEQLGGLDILVNNAGGGRGFPQGTTSIPDEEWQAGFALNLFAAIRLTNALLPALRESKAGAIVNISSGAAMMSIGAVAHYCAAKAALNSYSRTLAIDLAPSKIRVNIVSPGPVTTPGSRAFSDALGAPPDFFAKDIPLGRYGAPEDVAEVVALLASHRGKWMTGGIINVDGGMSAR